MYVFRLTAATCLLSAVLTSKVFAAAAAAAAAKLSIEKDPAGEGGRRAQPPVVERNLKDRGDRDDDDSYGDHGHYHDDDNDSYGHEHYDDDVSYGHQHYGGGGGDDDDDDDSYGYFDDDDIEVQQPPHDHSYGSGGAMKGGMSMSMSMSMATRYSGYYGSGYSADGDDGAIGYGDDDTPLPGHHEHEHVHEHGDDEVFYEEPPVLGHQPPSGNYGSYARSGKSMKSKAMGMGMGMAKAKGKRKGKGMAMAMVKAKPKGKGKRQGMGMSGGKMGARGFYSSPASHSHHNDYLWADDDDNFGGYSPPVGYIPHGHEALFHDRPSAIEHAHDDDSLIFDDDAIGDIDVGGGYKTPTPFVPTDDFGGYGYQGFPCRTGKSMSKAGMGMGSYNLGCGPTGDYAVPHQDCCGFEEVCGVPSAPYSSGKMGKGGKGMGLGAHFHSGYLGCQMVCVTPCADLSPSKEAEQGYAANHDHAPSPSHHHDEPSNHGGGYISSHDRAPSHHHGGPSHNHASTHNHDTHHGHSLGRDNVHGSFSADGDDDSYRR